MNAEEYYKKLDGRLLTKLTSTGITTDYETVFKIMEEYANLKLKESEVSEVKYSQAEVTDSMIECFKVGGYADKNNPHMAVIFKLGFEKAFELCQSKLNKK